MEHQCARSGDLKAHKDGVASLKEELSKSKSRVTELEEKSEMAESELLKREDKLRAISEENRRFREQVQGYKACERAYSSTTTFTDSAEDRNGDLNTIESTMACEDQDTDLASNGSVFPSEEAANPGPRSSPIDSNCPMGPEAVATGSPRRVSIAVTSSSSAEHAAATDLLFQHTSGALALTMNDAKIVIASEQLMEAASFTHFDVMKKEFRVELSL